MKKTFTTAQVMYLLNQVTTDKISFSRFVEILNETVESKLIFNIQKIDEKTENGLFSFLLHSESNGVNPAELSKMLHVFIKLHNEIADSLNKL